MMNTKFLANLIKSNCATKTTNLLALCCLLSLHIAHAQTKSNGKMYSCTDAKGKTYTSDTPIAECSKRAVNILDKNGLVRKKIPAPLTPEELKQQEQLKIQEQENAVLQKQREEAQRLLLLRYPNETALLRARDLAVAPVREEVLNSTRKLNGLFKEQENLINNPPKKKNTEYEQKLIVLMRDIQAEKAFLTNRTEYLSKIEEKFSKDIETYRLLTQTK